jgi:hypothetical protein
MLKVEGSTQYETRTKLPEVLMDDNADSLTPPATPLPIAATPLWKRLLACNPFYLASAALLLYGCYRVSLEPKLFNRETAHLYFNFLSLQTYECLLVLIAVFLAVKKIWYDSTLLTGLENMLLIVPFVLISQAALIQQGLLWILCATGLLLALGRLAMLRRFHPSLNFPRISALIAGAFLLLNAGLPILYRALHEHKYGTLPDWGAAYYTNKMVWLLLAPLVCASLVKTPFGKALGETWSERGWLPMGFNALWLVGTLVHLYCLGYIYDFPLSAELASPAIWSLCWIAFLRAPEVFPTISPNRRSLLLASAAAAPVIGFAERGSEILLTLATINTTAFASLLIQKRFSRICLNLMLCSVALAISDLPANWVITLFPDFQRSAIVLMAAAALFLIGAARSPNPVYGLCGALVLAIGTGTLLRGNANAAHWAGQLGFVFFLLHSLRWNDAAHNGAAAVRVCSGLAWVAHAITWSVAARAPWSLSLVGLSVLFAMAIVWRYSRASRVVFIGAAALAITLVVPAHLIALQVTSIPSGILAVLGSFVLLAIGTAVALTRKHWHTYVS